MITAAVTADFTPSNDTYSRLTTVSDIENKIAEITVWEHARFADVFRTVLYKRAQRAVAEGLDFDTISRYTETVEILDRAIRAQDMDMIVAYHQHILDAPNPSAIETALHVLKPMTTDRKVCSVITKEHIDSCAQISESFAVRRGMAAAECHEVITLAFHNLSRTPDIVDLLDQGVTTATEIVNILVPAQSLAERFAASR